MTDDARREVFEALLEEAERARAFPAVHDFRMRFEGQRDVIDALVREEAIRSAGPIATYMPTLKGLRTYDSPRAVDMLRSAADLLPTLQDIYERMPDAQVAVETIAERAGLDGWGVQRALAPLQDVRIWRSMSSGINDAATAEVVLDEGVQYYEPSDILGIPELAHLPPDVPVALRRIAIRGYRPFRAFDAALGDLTVIIGANAAGKSALLDFLRFLREAVSEPLPPEIDRQSIGRALFHAGQPPRLGCTLHVDMSIERMLRYDVEIHGPVGTPRVVREQLALAGPAHPRDSGPFLFLDFSAGKGMLHDPVQGGGMTPAPWSAPPNELALRRMIDPRYTAAHRLREAMSTWRVYAGFDVSVTSPMRQPIITESAPILAEDGHNLSAVLLWLQTEHRDLWDELETHLRSVIPNFRALQAKLVGRGQTIAVWREDGVADELTLADLSDGTLRFLCWLTLCLAPRPASLVCMDEPEIGLHPRVLPLLAGLCKRASEHTQVLLTTHSPYFLAQFDLDDIAIMRREDGQAVFARPGSSAALRDMIAELGGDELMRMHISDELETLA